MIHNDVKTIELSAEISEAGARGSNWYRSWPDAKTQLESIMSDFHHRRSNVLVCSTIVENGLDIPNANTIIIQRADKLGLSQLHQLRGGLDEVTAKRMHFYCYPRREK